MSRLCAIVLCTLALMIGILFDTQAKEASLRQKARQKQQQESLPTNQTQDFSQDKAYVKYVDIYDTNEVASTNRQVIKAKGNSSNYTNFPWLFVPLQNTTKTRLLRL